MTIYKTNFDRRQQRNRRKLKATSNNALRLSVFKSNSNIYAQIIDVKSGCTLVSASTLDSEVLKTLGVKCANIKAAIVVGQEIGKRAKAIGLEVVVFDRGGYKYHGQVKALADAAREAGLKF